MSIMVWTTAQFSLPIFPSLFAFRLFFTVSGSHFAADSKYSTSEVPAYKSAEYKSVKITCHRIPDCKTEIRYNPFEIQVTLL